MLSIGEIRTLQAFKSCALIYLVLVFFTNSSIAEEAKPDFEGTWMPARGPGLTKAFPRSDWNFTAKGKAQYEAYASKFNPDKDDPAHFCVGPGMPPSMAGGAPFPLEIIQREFDITLFFESYAQYRKIYIDGYDRPEPILPTSMGYSVGKWEGQTLVIKTTMLQERTLGRIQMSANATIEEKWYLGTNDEGTRMLYADLVFSDPEIYKENIEFRGAWVDSPGTPIMEYVCPLELYDLHLQRVLRGQPE